MVKIELGIFSNTVFKCVARISDLDTSESGGDSSVQRKPAVSKKVGRNDPCPCGSGKKYKKCCGANNNDKN